MCTLVSTVNMYLQHAKLYVESPMVQIFGWRHSILTMQITLRHVNGFYAVAGI